MDFLIENDQTNEKFLYTKIEYNDKKYSIAIFFERKPVLFRIRDGEGMSEDIELSKLLNKIFPHILDTIFE